MKAIIVRLQWLLVLFAENSCVIANQPAVIRYSPEYGPVGTHIVIVGRKLTAKRSVKLFLGPTELKVLSASSERIEAVVPVHAQTNYLRLTLDGTPVIWSDMDYRQKKRFVVTRSDTEEWRTVSVGTYRTCGVKVNGKLYCWGVAGLTEITKNYWPFPSLATRGTWSSVSAGYSFRLDDSCAVDSDQQ